MHATVRGAGAAQSRALSALLPAATGVLAFLAAVAVSGSMKGLLACLMLFGVFALAMALKRPREVLLFAWVLSLTYNRQYFLAQDMGAQAPYFLVSDFFLLLLAGGWLYEIVVLKRAPRSLGGRAGAWYLPFALVALASAVVAVRPDWTGFEMVRVLKVGFVLLYARHNLGRTQWWVCLAGVGAAMAFQSLLGLIQIPTGGQGGLLYLFGGKAAVEVPEAFQGTGFYGWRRATGTMNHPPVLACYLLLVVPVFVALALAHPRRRVRTWSGAAGGVGLAGLAATLSRWPWLVMAVQLTALLVALAWRGVIPVRRALGILAVVGLAGTLAVLPVTGKVHQRVTGDLDASIEQRANGFRMALAMLRDHNLLLGVGLNNYRVHMPRYASYDPETAWTLENEDVAVKLNTRFLSGPQNGFLFVLTETGVLGLAAFLFYLAGVLLAGARAVAASRDYRSAAALGLLVGIGGVLAQQAIDYSYWVDPVLYTFALFVGMIHNAGVLAPPDAPAGAFVRPAEGAPQ